MSAINDILGSKRKPKEKVEDLALVLKKDPGLISELMEFFSGAPGAEKGTCVEAIEYVTKDDPGFAESCLDFVIGQLNAKEPRVKWEASRIVGNVAFTFPEKAVAAIPQLLINTKDAGTVVRWSAAFALTEIAKSNQKTGQELLSTFREIVQTEDNNGVKNVYQKVMKQLIDK